MMVPGHRSAIKLFQQYATNGQDPDIKAFAEQTLPVLKEHLTIITGIDNKMKKSTASK
jgi:putative membrane protein